MRQAQNRASLEDFGDPWFVEPREALIDFINRDAALITPEDYRVTREEIRSAFKFYADSYATV